MATQRNCLEQEAEIIESDNFDRIFYFFVCVIHSMTTMLEFMHSNKDGATDDKELETTRSRYDLLVDE